jgi:hypothetical protein
LLVKQKPALLKNLSDALLLGKAPGLAHKQ